DSKWPGVEGARCRYSSVDTVVQDETDRISNSIGKHSDDITAIVYSVCGCVLHTSGRRDWQQCRHVDLSQCPVIYKKAVEKGAITIASDDCAEVVDPRRLSQHCCGHIDCGKSRGGSGRRSRLGQNAHKQHYCKKPFLLSHGSELLSSIAHLTARPWRKY